ncbi:LOW QUALITY PROTEIN: uncharacterized protein LOC134202460 [Armigeres subalbatus]|uniref:LOW QUALITY PROTEIN: uncharacterized protein LOC134202460 n=1 Tax=Armigeres subalbatus TaxID=124917 RepID=UPI002ED227C2
MLLAWWFVLKETDKRRFIYSMTLDIRQAYIIQLDSASDITVICEQTWHQLGNPQTTPPSINAVNASGKPLGLIGEFECNVTFNGTTKRGKCFVSSSPSLNVFGIDWIDMFNLWALPFDSICNSISSTTKPAFDDEIQKLRSDHPNVFDDSLGHCTKTKRPVPFNTIPLVDTELNRLESMGIITPIDFSEWAAPIVAVRKPNGRVRICADYSTGLNNALEANHYPLPTPEEIFAQLAGSRVFSIIDLSDAYLQVEVDDDSKKLLGRMNKKYYAVKILHYGRKSPVPRKPVVEVEFAYPEVNLQVPNDDEDGLSKEVPEKSTQISDFHFATALRRFGSVLLQKNQTPQMKKMKSQAAKEMIMHFLVEHGIELTEKQILKKVNNMKSRIKSKTDKKATGNKQISLNPGERIIYDLLGAEENPAVTKVNYGVSVGSSSTAVMKRSSMIISDDEEDMLNSLVNVGRSVLNVLAESGQIGSGKSRTSEEQKPQTPSGCYKRKPRRNQEKLSNAQLQQNVLIKQCEVLEQQKRINERLEVVLDKAGELLNRYLE